jgi:hypothetical protein
MNDGGSERKKVRESLRFGASGLLEARAAHADKSNAVIAVVCPTPL